MSARESKRVIFCGTRGVPACYGGFETAVDEISRRFVKSGYDCAVVCRKSSGGEAPERHEGRRLVYVRGTSSRTMDTFASAFQTGLHLLRHRREYDHAFWFNNANLPGILLTLLARIPTSVNTDGMEWRRAKWGWPFKAYYLFASLLIALLCKSVISDSVAMQEFYRRTFFKDTQFVPYGVTEVPDGVPEKRRAVMEEYGLVPGRFFLQITRFEPDNLPLENALAFRGSGLAAEGFAFLLVGYQRETPYARRLKVMSGRDGVLVADAIYDPEVLAVLRKGCFCYIHGNSVGGTNPALLEAMATCPRIAAIEGPFSREILGRTGLFFRLEDLIPVFRRALSLPDCSADLQERVRERYQWDEVARSYMRLAEGRPSAYRATKGEQIPGPAG